MHARGGEVDTAEAWAACMRTQDFGAAWRIADAVLAGRDRAGRDDPRLPYHQRWVWDGTRPDGLAVLVRCYHGLGDTLQFARLLPALRARAAHVTLECQPALCPLLAGTAGVDRLVPFDPAAPLPAGPCDMEIMELGHVLRADAPALAACVPYLSTPPDGAARDAIALCWAAGGWDPDRSITLAPLLEACAAPGRRFVSLQRGPAAAEATRPDFVNPGDGDTDILRTAGLASAARCVVTVDTMVAHLAGALGRPMLLLLKAAPDWRWPSPGVRSAWYPTATILHQAVAGRWDAPLARVRSAL